MTPLKDDILGTIESEGITPKSRIWFVFGHVAIWVLFVITIIIGAMSFGMTLFEFFGSERSLALLARSMGARVHALSLLPYVWGGMLLLSVILALVFFRNTEKGYRYEPWKVITLLIVSSLILGAGLYFARGSEFADQYLRNNAPKYQQLREHLEDKILDPELGVLGGVIQLTEADTVVVQNPNGESYEVEFACESEHCEKIRENPVMDRPVLLIGEKNEEGNFVIKDARRPDRKKIQKVLRGELRPGKKDGMIAPPIHKYREAIQEGIGRGNETTRDENPETQESDERGVDAEMPPRDAIFVPIQRRGNEIRGEENTTVRERSFESAPKTASGEQRILVIPAPKFDNQNIQENRRERMQEIREQKRQQIQEQKSTRTTR